MTTKHQLLNTAAADQNQHQHNERRELLTPRDIATIYGIPLSTQAKGRMTGDSYPYVKRGRSVYAFRSDVEDWLRSLRRHSTADRGQGGTICQSQTE